MLNQLNAVKGLVVWSVVRDSFSLRESLPKSSMEISGIFDQQVVGFELGCPSNIIQKDALNRLHDLKARHDDFFKNWKLYSDTKLQSTHGSPAN